MNRQEGLQECIQPQREMPCDIRENQRGTPLDISSVSSFPRTGTHRQPKVIRQSRWGGTPDSAVPVDMHRCCTIDRPHTICTPCSALVEQSVGELGTLPGATGRLCDASLMATMCLLSLSLGRSHPDPDRNTSLHTVTHDVTHTN